jgi:hypothetical protein
MKYSDLHWKIFNFLVRRIVAVGFVAVGLILTLYGLPSLLPGGIVLVDGVPSDNLVLRWVAVILPLVLALFGIALFRAQPYVPSKE